MAVKITATGIDTVQDNIITGSKIQDNGITYDDLYSGCCIQAINSIYTSRTSYTILTYDTDVPGMSLTITPRADNSKFLIIIRHLFEVDGNWDVVYNIQRNGSRINMGGLTAHWSGLSMGSKTYSSANNNDSTPEFLSFRTLDTTGSTKNVPITFKLVSATQSNRTSFVNRTFGSDGQSNYETSTSEIIIMEIKG